MPLDTFVKKPVQRMEVADAPDSVPEVQKICQQVIDKWEGRHAPFAGIERHAFYERSRQAFAIVATGEQRSYGCIIVKKGVVTGTARPAICERSSCFSKWLHSAHEQPAEARISYPFHPRFAEAAPTKAAYFRHSVVEEKSYQDARTSWWSGGDSNRWPSRARRDLELFLSSPVDRPNTPSPLRGNFGMAWIRSCVTPRRWRFRSTSGRADQEQGRPTASQFARGAVQTLVQGGSRGRALARSSSRCSTACRQRAIRCRRPPLCVRSPGARPSQRQDVGSHPQPTCRISRRVPRTKAPPGPRRPPFHDPLSSR
jgi:hypothetical protein